MPTIPSNSDTEDCLRLLLQADGFILSNKRGYGETGVDILAKKQNEQFHIEVIGYKSSPPARAKDFYEAFFRVVSRLNDGAEHCAIAMPVQAERGLPQRMAQHRTAWQRIGAAFPELEIWLVDTKQKTHRKTKWNEWL